MIEDGYTPEGLEELRRERYASVLALFRPYALAALRKRVAEEIIETSFDNSELYDICIAVYDTLRERGESYEVASRYTRDVSRRLVKVEALPPEDRPAQYDIEHEADDALDSLVACWCWALRREAGQEGEAESSFECDLDLSALGDDMLPREFAEGHLEEFRRDLVWVAITEERMRFTLRMVRANLGGEAGLPEAMIRFLEAWNINCVRR